MPLKEKGREKVSKLSDIFTARWAALFEWIAEKYPGFWEDLRDEIRDFQDRQITTQNAVVEIPTI